MIIVVCVYAKCVLECRTYCSNENDKTGELSGRYDFSETKKGNGGRNNYEQCKKTKVWDMSYKCG